MRGIKTDALNNKSRSMGRSLRVSMEDSGESLTAGFPETFLGLQEIILPADGQQPEWLLIDLSLF